MSVIANGAAVSTTVVLSREAGAIVVSATHLRVARSHRGVAPEQYASEVHATQAFGVAATSQAGVAPPQCPSPAQASTGAAVPGDPSGSCEGNSVVGSPFRPAAETTAPLRSVPEVPASMVASNATVKDSPMAMLPPCVEVAPMPTRAVSVRVPASKS